MPTTKDVDERPIIFNDWSINRILAGEKTQTRRIVQPQPPDDINEPFWDDEGQEWQANHDTRQNGRPMTLPRWTAECPYGQPGAWLWVREAFRLPEWAEDMSPTEWVDRAAVRTVQFPADGEKIAQNGGDVGRTQFGRKRPSIHMPRELSRIRLRVETVRVERVQSITEADAESEGIVYGKDAVGSAKIAFRRLWKSIHGDGAWERNDWVWVVEFSRLEP